MKYCDLLEVISFRDAPQIRNLMNSVNDAIPYVVNNVLPSAAGQLEARVKKAQDKNESETSIGWVILSRYPSPGGWNSSYATISPLEDGHPRGYQRHLSIHFVLAENIQQISGICCSKYVSYFLGRYTKITQGSESRKHWKLQRKSKNLSTSSRWCSFQTVQSPFESTCIIIR